MNVSKKEYFDYLYSCLKKNSLLPQERAVWRTSLQYSFDLLEIDSELIPKLRMETGRGFENVFLVNSRKALLIRGSRQDRDSLLFCRTAVYFAVLGCVLDHMIDNGTEEQRQTAFDCLKRERLSVYFEEFSEPLSDSAADKLFAYIGQGLRLVKQTDLNEYHSLTDMIGQAAGSELYVSGEESGSNSCTDKSVLFTVIPMRIAAVGTDTGNHRLFYNVGTVFQLIDDLYDIFEDRALSRKNIIADRIEKDAYWKNTVDDILTRIMYHIQIIKENSTDAFYDLIFSEIKEWSMSCGYFRTALIKEKDIVCSDMRIFGLHLR